MIVDTEATYTVLPKEVVETVGAFKLPIKVSLELGDGRVIEAETYAAVVKIAEREGPVIIASFKGARPFVGVQTLES